jgi:hypothetical protein
VPDRLTALKYLTALLSIAGGGLIIALIRLGRTGIPRISAEWAFTALTASAALALLLLAQTGLLLALRPIPPLAALQTVARSFRPLVLFWPFLLAVTFSDWANHLFVHYRTTWLYWCVVWIAFVVVQVFLPVLHADDALGWLRREWRAARAAFGRAGQFRADPDRLPGPAPDGAVRLRAVLPRRPLARLPGCLQTGPGHRPGQLAVPATLV